MESIFDLNEQLYGDEDEDAALRMQKCGTPELPPGAVPYEGEEAFVPSPKKPVMRATVVNQVRERDKKRYYKLLDESWRHKPVERRWCQVTDDPNSRIHVPVRCPDAYRFPSITDHYHEAVANEHEDHRSKFTESHKYIENTDWPFYHKNVTEHSEYWSKKVDKIAERQDDYFRLGSFPVNLVPQATSVGMLSFKKVSSNPQDEKPEPLRRLRIHAKKAGISEDDLFDECCSAVVRKEEPKVKQL